MTKSSSKWQVYRTRFLIRAKPLTRPLVFVDVFGREHRGKKGDYLVEDANGAQRIAPRNFFEDVYVAMHAAWPDVDLLGTVEPARTASPNHQIAKRRKGQSTPAWLVEKRPLHPASRRLIA